MSQTPSTDPAANPDGPRAHQPPVTVPGGGGERADLAALQRRLAQFAQARQWGQYHTPKNLSAALSVEAGELVEIFQWLTPEESARIMSDPGQAARVEDEVADVLAYLLQFCEVLGVDAPAALAAKIERNERRFPVPHPHHAPGPTEASD